MRRLGWIALFLCGLPACGVDRQQRVRDYAEDGLLLYQHGDYRHARLDFEAALRLAPNDPTLEYDLAQCWDRLDRPERAEPLYREVISRSPNNPEARHALTVLLVRTDRRNEAVQMVQSWLAARPKLSSPYVEDAYLWHAYGDLPAALGRLQQALDLDAHDNRALVEMGRLYEEMHYPGRAMALYERALAYQPYQPDVEARLAQLRQEGATDPRPH